MVTFVSDTSWQVYNSDPASGPSTALGPAQLVCLNSQSPSPCPSGATLYGFTGTGWRADISSIPGAHWVWAPNINGSTTPAELNQFYFSKSFQLNGTKVFGSISISADDFAEVRVNGQVVGSIGSVSDFPTAASAQSFLTTFDLSAFLHSGDNIVTIRAENGAFGLCCPSTYAGNPAGTVFGGSFRVPSFQISPNHGPIGTKVTVQGSGIPSTQLEMTFDDALLGIQTGSNATFSFTFNVPEAQAGPHAVKAVDTFTGTTVASATFVVTRIDTLALNVDVGTLYFPSDTVTIYTLATLSGTPLNSSNLQLQLTLTKPDGSNVTLSVVSIGAGMFKSTYKVPASGAFGTYAVVAKGHVSNAQDQTALTTFEVKQSWLSAQGTPVTATAVGLAGAVAFGAVAWKRGVFRSKNGRESSIELN